MNILRHVWRFLLRIFQPSPQIPIFIPPLPIDPPPIIEVSDSVPITDPDLSPELISNGLRHDWRHARAAWLYPGDENWLASHRMMTWTSDRIQQYLDHPDVCDQTHVIVCCNTGTRTILNEKPFDGLKNPDKVRTVFQQIIENDKAPICWVMSQEFFIQILNRSHKKLLDYLKVTCEMVADVSQIVVPFREIGDIYDGHHMAERNEIFKEMRRGAPHLPLACHERSMEQIPVDDFKGISGDVISGLQTGFGTPTGGNNNPSDRIMHGDYTYDGAAGFVKNNSERMAGWQEKGRMERHTNAVFEHSIPLIYEGQPWKPARNIEDAQKRGKILLQHGAEFDLSSGSVR